MSDHGSHHIVGPKTYVTNLLILMGLMFLTIAAAKVHIGPAGSQVINFIIAMAIAIAKMMCILLYFMHLKWSSGLVRVMGTVAFLFLGIMLAFTFGDYTSREWVSTFAPSPYGN